MLLQLSVRKSVCVCEYVTHIVASPSNLKPALRAHLSRVVDR